MNRIKVIEHDDTTGRLKEIYNEIIEKRGKLANVNKIQSLRPESIVRHMDLYLEVMFTKSELSRAEREMMAVVVSAANECDYCIQHHGEALNHYWKNRERLAVLVSDYSEAGLTDRELSLCDDAKTLTINPGSFRDEALINFLKLTGLSDNAILDATLVISYFTFVNRIVIALGLETNELEKEGYNF